MGYREQQTAAYDNTFGDAKVDTNDRAAVLARIESRYDFDRGAYADLSVLAWISVHQDALAEEYMDRWFPKNRSFDEKWWEAIERFEQVRFGNPLFRSAHGVLAFAIRKRADPKSCESKQSEEMKLKRPEGLTPDEKHRRMLAAAHDVAQGMRMPGAPAYKEQGPPPRDTSRDEPTQYEPDEDALFQEARA